MKYQNQILIKPLRNSLILLILLMSSSISTAQSGFRSFLDLGKTNVSESYYLTENLVANYDASFVEFSGGVMLDLFSSNPYSLSGAFITANKDLHVKEYPVNLGAYFLLNRFSDHLYETNWGVLAKTKKYERLEVSLGINFKTYSLRSESVKPNKLNENFGLVYKATVFVKPTSNPWNISLNCTNIDFFLVNQPTNPLFSVNAKYEIKSGLDIFAETWYKQAGIFNIHAQYFGHLFRGGVIWEF